MKKRWIALWVLVALIAAFFAFLWWIGREESGPRPDLDLALAPQADPATLGPDALPEMPPVNPLAADGVNPMPHGEPAQQNSTMIAGPMDTSRALTPEEKAYVWLGPGYFGAYTSSPYPDGRRVLWLNGVNGRYKVDYETYEILAHDPSPEAEEYNRKWTEEITASLDDDNSLWALPTSVRAILPLTNLSGVYAVVGRNGWFYLARKDGSVVAYGDAVEGDPESDIVLKAEFQLPEGEAGPSVGMNMTFDGWIVFPTEDGVLVAVSPDLSEHRSVKLTREEGEDTSSQGTGYGWVRNSVAIDEDAGVYVASRNHMHKVIWTGDGFSTEEADGAWTAQYRNGGGQGTGATPSLMGFGEEDRFVVITDGDPRMNVTLFWRDEIPEDWQQLPGAPSRRIAGLAPANMGELSVQRIQSEQTVIVAGYGALVVNNRPRNIPWWFPKDGFNLGFLVGPLGSNPDHQPYGVQKFRWNPELRRFEQAWVNETMSSPNGVPWVSLGSGQVYLVGARDNQWTLEAIDWYTGRPTFHYVLGGQQWNNNFSGPTIDEQGRAFIGTQWGRMRVQPARTIQTEAAPQ